MKISAISLLSYDWHLSLLSIASYCHHVDEVLVGVDKNRMTYAGNRFHLPDQVLQAIADLPNVKIVEEDFYSRAETTMGRETRQRNDMSLQAAGDWVIQIDADEIALNMPQFVEWMGVFDEEERERQVMFHNGFSDFSGKKVARPIKARWRTIWKQIDGKYLVIEETPKYTIWLGSREKGMCGQGRQPGELVDGKMVVSRDKESVAVVSPLLLLHHSYDRSEAEVEQKLKNWSHSDHWPTGHMFELWKGTTLDNYQTIKNFFPHIDCPHRWASLKLYSREDLYRA